MVSALSVSDILAGVIGAVTGVYDFEGGTGVLGVVLVVGLPLVVSDDDTESVSEM